MLTHIDYSLYLVTDTQLCNHFDLVATVERAVTAGVTCVQLREKNKEKKAIVEIGLQLMKILKPYGVPLIVNDYVDVAVEINADGVHIGQSDADYFEVRDKLGYEKIIGLSIENISQAERCKNWDVDYFGVGPIFQTQTKPDAAPHLGFENLKTIRKIIHNKPIVAIGGINHVNAADICATRVDGIAVVSAIMSAKDPTSAAQKLREIIKYAREK